VAILTEKKILEKFSEKMFHWMCCSAYIYELRKYKQVKVTNCKRKDGLCCRSCMDRCRLACSDADYKVSKCGVDLPYFLGQRILLMKSKTMMVNYFTFKSYCKKRRKRYGK